MKIIKLKPFCAHYPWGGDRLPKMYGKQSWAPCAESWELFLGADKTTCDLDGVPLSRLIDSDDLGVACSRFERFPLLIKLIDARENLSVQVHPDDRFAKVHENSYGKTEAWHVVCAQPDSCVYVGLNRDMNREEVLRAIEDGSILENMNRVRLRKGDNIFIPAGTLHALGAGCLVYEIQQNSDITYRVYDYDRIFDGKKRELHTDKALCVMNYSAVVPQVSRDTAALECEYFSANVMKLSGTSVLPLCKTSFTCVTVIEGAGELNGEPICQGDSVFISAAEGQIKIKGTVTLISATVPCAN